MATSDQGVTDRKVPDNPEIPVFFERSRGYFVSGFAIPLGLSLIRLGLSAEWNSALECVVLGGLNE